MKLLLLFCLMQFSLLSQEEIDLMDTLVYEFVDEEASFVGGSQGLQKWIVTNFRYPTGHRENHAPTGTVWLYFVVEKDGTISNIKIGKCFNDDSSDAEAIRLVSSMPKWIPAKNNGKLVRSKCLIPIKFVLN